MNAGTTEKIKALQGWEALEINGEALQGITSEQEKIGRELASVFHRAFVQNPDGAACLTLMMQQTLLKPTVLPNDTSFAAGIREGRCDLVRQILVNIELAEGE